MVGVLDSLEGKELVARRPDRGDRRGSVVVLTDTGRGDDRGGGPGQRGGPAGGARRRRRSPGGAARRARRSRGGAAARPCSSASSGGRPRRIAPWATALGFPVRPVG